MSNLFNLNYFNIEYKYEYKISNPDNLCILCIGQIRNFFELKDSFSNFINTLKKIFKNITIFFYISLDTTKPYWQYINHKNEYPDLSWDDYTKGIQQKYNISEELFYEKIKFIDINYIIHIRNKNEDDITFKNCNHNPYLIQHYFLVNCLKLVSEYEKNNNMKFDFVIKTRPDVIYLYETYNFYDIIDNKYDYIYDWDFSFNCHRNLSLIIENTFEDILKNYNSALKIILDKNNLNENYIVTFNHAIIIILLKNYSNIKTFSQKMVDHKLLKP
jgi:hypothetical protein